MLLAAKAANVPRKSFRAPPDDEGKRAKLLACADSFLFHVPVECSFSLVSACSVNVEGFQERLSHPIVFVTYERVATFKATVQLGILKLNRTCFACFNLRDLLFDLLLILLIKNLNRIYYDLLKLGTCTSKRAILKQSIKLQNARFLNDRRLKMPV